MDAVSIFTAPQALTSPLTWSVPGGNYRGQGVWVRYTDGSHFTGILDAATTPPALGVTPAALAFAAVRNGSLPPASTLNITQPCGSFDWQVTADVPWLQTQAIGNTLTVGVDQSGLNTGGYLGTLTLSAKNASSVQPISVPVQLFVVDQLFPVYLPRLQK